MSFPQVNSPHWNAEEVQNRQFSGILDFVNISKGIGRSRELFPQINTGDFLSIQLQDSEKHQGWKG